MLEASARLFGRYGVAQVSLRDVAAEARVNLGLINRYIGGREELIFAVFADLTDQLVDEIRTDPTAPRGFEADSIMNRWVRVLAYLVQVDPDAAVRIGTAPMDELAAIVEVIYDQSPEAARLRVAQLMGSAIGWRLFEPFLVASAGLGDMPLDEVRLELTRTHRRLGATPYPSPADPPERVS